LRERDPRFSEQTLTHRITPAFTQVQQAWCRQDLEPIRHFVSDGIYERFSLQIQEQQEAGWRDQMEQIQVLEVQVVQIESDPVFDTVTVRIRASAVDQEVDTRTGKRLSGGKHPEVFTEYWSFIRRPGAQTLTGAGLIEGNCPNCGAGLKLNEAAACAACGALVKSGEYDWVLAEITQACEWQTREQAEVPGVAVLRGADAGFSLQHLEDRVSVMYWRLMAAWRAGRSAPIRKMATDTFCQEAAVNWKPDAQGIHSFPGDCAVGAVETLGIIAGEPFDRALAAVRWSGATYTRDAAGEIRKTAAARVATHIFILIRKHGATSSIDRTLASAHCPSCGAAAGAGTANACEYCGTVLNDGTQDWVLEGFRMPNDPVVDELRRELTRAPAATAPGTPAAKSGAATGRGGIELAAWLVQVMLADGQVDGDERALIDAYGQARGINPAQIDALIAAQRAGQLEAPQPATAAEAQAWLETMAEMALADGFIVKEERQAILAVGHRLQFTAHDVNQVILRKRRELYQASKRALREARQSASRG